MKPVPPYPMRTESRLTALRQRELATHTGETAHPQWQAGGIAARLADRCMSRYRLVLAPRLRRTHRGLEASRRRRFPWAIAGRQESLVVYL